jgi:hypothetical protein
MCPSFCTVAYVTSYSGYVNLINVAEPTNPVLIGYYVNPDFSCRLFLDSNLVYVTCHECGLSILEWTEPGIVEQHNGNFIHNWVQLSVAPNPVSGIIFLTMLFSGRSEYQIDLFNIQGRRIICLDKSKGAGLESKEYYLHDIPNGVYFLIFKYENRKLAKKIIVIH